MYIIFTAEENTLGAELTAMSYHNSIGNIKNYFSCGAGWVCFFCDALEVCKVRLKAHRLSLIFEVFN